MPENRHDPTRADPNAVSDPNGVTIRPATADDAIALCSVWRRSINEICDRDYDTAQRARWCENKTPENLALWTSDPDGRVLAAVASGGWVVGVGYVRFKPARAEILGCYIVPEALGRGVGTALLMAMEQEARHRGAAVINLRSTTTARPFYLRHGFAEEGPPSGAIPSIPMSKRLAT